VEQQNKREVPETDPSTYRNLAFDKRQSSGKCGLYKNIAEMGLSERQIVVSRLCHLSW
jgi:hypothetical protein